MPRLQALRLQRPNCRDDADVWFWGSALFDKLGRFAGLGQEMENDRARKPDRLSRPANRDRRHRHRAANSIDVHTGEGVLHYDLAHLRHHRTSIRRSSSPAMHAARQQHGDISFHRRSTACIIRSRWLSMALLPLIVLLAGAARCPPRSASWPPPRRWRSLDQCLRLRRAVQSARPLWRAHRLARDIRRRTCRGERLAAAPRWHLRHFAG